MAVQAHTPLARLPLCIQSPASPSDVTSPVAEKKKKRKLGGAKRVLTEEEILHFQDQSLRGGAVPRLVKGGF